MDYKQVKKKNLAILPSPIQKLEKLSKKYSANIYIKRDDLVGLGLGGNKVRKLEYLIADALEEDSTCLLTYGGVQTNHGMLTVACGAKAGLKTILILSNYDEEEPALSGNLVLDTILGADIRYVDLAGIEPDSEEYQLRLEEASREAVEEYEKRGDRVYSIPFGGSSSLGALAYVKAMEEILDQSQEIGIDFDYIVCGQGSKGTFSGLWLGSKYYKIGTEVIGINVMEKDEGFKAQVADFINKTSEAYSLGIKCLNPQELRIEDEYFGPGYALADERTFGTIIEMARLEGIFLDPTYTGKAFTGLLDLVSQGQIDRDADILFIHTGGYPGIFSDASVNFIKENPELFELRDD